MRVIEVSREKIRQLSENGGTTVEGIALVQVL